MEGFRARYHILQGVTLQYCAPDQTLTDRKEGVVVIPMIAFIEGGMTLPMDRVTKDYLINHRLCPHQCIPNMFRVLGNVDALNKQMNLGLTWHDIIQLYECHSLFGAGFYLKSWSDIVRLVSCLPKSNKGLKDDYLIIFVEWHNGLHCLTREGEPSRVPQDQVPQQGIQPFQLYFLSPLTLCLSLLINFNDLTMISFSDFFVDKRHVASRLSLVNVSGLNKLLRLEIFISEDGCNVVGLFCNIGLGCILRYLIQMF